MILLLALSICFGVLTILLAHYLRVQRLISSEMARKNVHIAHALIIGSWPFFTSYEVVIAGEILSLLLVVIARVFKLFGPFREVQRLTWGEFFFPLAVIIMALFSPNEWLFLAAVLHFGLADGFAAIIGHQLKIGQYAIMGHKKSVAGTSVFWLVSFAITSWFIYNHTSLETPLFPMALIIPTLTTLAENISPWGSDNLTVPLVALWLLSMV